MTPTTYSFSTFQELIDRVPSDKIELCMTELGKAFAQAKQAVELIGMVATDLANANGETLLKIPKTPERLIHIPEVIEWIDDDKGIIETGITTPTGERFMTINSGGSANG